MVALDQVRFLGFDVFGTVVDWRTGVARAAEPFLRRNGVDIDPLHFADRWRELYQPAMEKVRSGERPWVRLSVLNRENLDSALDAIGRPALSFPGEELNELNLAWERLEPWPDSVEGLTRLKRRFAIGALSNGDLATMTNLARFGHLPWDVIVGAEVTRSYKPQPQTYLGSADAVGVAPDQAGMVAAHNSDLHAARSCGLHTLFVRRSTEHGPGQTTDLDPDSNWKIAVNSLTEIADALGC
jgi:2-haloacid dehalogenase